MSIPVLAEHLQARGRHALLVPTAANPLGEPGIADEVEPELTSAGLRVERLDLDGETVVALPAAVWRLTSLRSRVAIPSIRGAARGAARPAFGDAAGAALAAGAVYVGYSAGAIVAGPTLEPVRLDSPVCAAAGT